MLFLKQIWDWINAKKTDPATGTISTDDKAASLRRTVMFTVAGFVLGGTLAASCKPDFLKETKEQTKTIQSQKETINALTERNTTLTQVMTSYEKKSKTRRVQKGYLDGQGNAVRDAKGNPVLLETITVMNSDSGTEQVTQLKDQLREAKTTIAQNNVEIAMLKTSKVEQRDGMGINVGGNLDLNNMTVHPTAGVGKELIKVPFFNIPVNATFSVSK